MNAFTIIQYLCGSAAAIRRVASSPVALPVGIVLVAMAGVARNYDQMVLDWNQKWFLGPLVFSLISGTWLLLFVDYAWRRSAETQAAQKEEEAGAAVVPDGESERASPDQKPWVGPAAAGAPIWRRAWSFFGLFWLTAPVAWLYAIPVERFCDPVEAARWNVRLLAMVSFWRVLLMARVVAVTTGMSFWRGMGWILFPVSVEALLLSLMKGFGAMVLSSMGGLRHSPAEEVLISALGNVVILFIVGLLLGLFLFLTSVAKSRFSKAPAPDRTDVEKPWRIPWVFLLIASVGWWWASLKPQQEIRLTAKAQSLAARSDWRGLLEFLSQHRREDFSPSIVLPPSPYERQSAPVVPEVFRALRPDTAPWVRQMVTGSLAALLQNDGLTYILPAEAQSALREVVHLQPEGAELLARYPNAFRLLGVETDTGTVPGKPEAQPGATK